MNFKINPSLNSSIGSAQPLPVPLSDFDDSNNLVTPDIDGKDIFTSADKMIASAKKSLKLEMYDFQNKQVDGKDGAVGVPGYEEQQNLLPLIIQAAQRGVKVQVLLDGSTISSTGLVHNQKMLDYLKSNGVQVLFYPADSVNIDHVKLMVIDGQDALIGGMNWSSHSPVNHDADVRIEGPAAKDAEQIFDQDWAFSNGKSYIQPSVAVPSGNIKFITTSPTKEDGGAKDIEAALIDNINRAQKSIHAEIYVFTDSLVIQAMKDAHHRGVDVKVIFDPSQVSANQAAFDELSKAGIQTRWYDADTSQHQLLHAKWGVFDDNALLIGSANWTHNGLSTDLSNAPQGTRANHEADVEIKDQALSNVFEKQFQEDWDNHTRPA